MYAGCTIGYDRGKKLKSQKRSKTDLRPTITTRASAKWASHGNPTACGWTPGFTRPGRAVYPSLPWSVPVKFHWLHGGNSHEFPLICDQHHPTATGFIGCMSSSSSLPDTQLASLIDRPNFSNLASGEQSHRRALGLHLSQLQSKLLPLEVLAWHVSEVKRCILIHSTPVNPQHMIQLDSHQCPSNNCINFT